MVDAIPETAMDLLPRILGALDTGVIVLDAQRRVRVWNAWMAQASGCPTHQAVGADFHVLFPNLRDTRIDTAIAEALETGVPAVLSHTLNRFLLGLKRADGEPMMHSTTVRRLDLAPRAEPLCLVQITDVTPAAQRDRLLRERREARYRAVVDTAQDAIVTTDMNGTIQWLNRAAVRQFGYSADEATGQPIGLLLGADAAAWLVPQGVAPEAPLEATGHRRDGGTLSLEVSLARWSVEGIGSITGILRDVTERRRVQQELHKLVEQKSILLREVNHRVKNSLHLVSSLLQLQARTLSDPALRHQMQDAIGRIHAIAQVHSRLYQTERFQTVELATYLRALCQDLANASGAKTGFDLKVDAEEVELPIDLAIPLGIIANELVTNAIKHGSGKALEVRVSLARAGKRVLFTVADNGPGLPDGFDVERTKSLGMRIVATLSRQIGGTLDILPDVQGAAFRLAVPLVGAP